MAYTSLTFSNNSRFYLLNLHLCTNPYKGSSSIHDVVVMVTNDPAEPEGAAGYTPPSLGEEFIPEWQPSSADGEDEEMREVRRRRLQKFSSQNSHGTLDKDKEADNLALD